MYLLVLAWWFAGSRKDTRERRYMSRGGPVVIIIFFFIIILRRMGKNIALAPHTSTYFHTRRVRILTQLLSQPNASWRTLRLAGAPFGITSYCRLQRLDDSIIWTLRQTPTPPRTTAPRRTMTTSMPSHGWAAGMEGCSMTSTTSSQHSITCDVERSRRGLQFGV